jgi:cell division protein FtsN
MPDKPSLYVVEKKEVIILVVLFVLVTVTSFTLGVRYGESVGKKTAIEHAQAARELGEASVEGGTGTLGGHDKQPEETPKAESHGGSTAESHDKGGGESSNSAKGDHSQSESHKDAGTSHRPESPEMAAKSSNVEAKSNVEAVDKNSDEYLLNALKEAGVEPPGGKSPKGAKLPEEVKALVSAPKIPAGSFVIQVGSHPTRTEAESQVRSLKARKVNAEILAPFKDRQGEWHRVVLGSYRNKKEADKEAASLKGKGSIASFFVWRLP